MSDQEGDRCPHVKDSGERCGVDFGLNPSTGLCFTHDPERRAEREEAWKRGGKTSGGHNKAKTRTAHEEDAPAPPETVADAVRWASWATWAVSVGKIDRGTGRDIGYLVRTFLKGLEKTAVADEVEEIRKMLRTLGRRVEEQERQAREAASEENKVRPIRGGKGA